MRKTIVALALLTAAAGCGQEQAAPEDAVSCCERGRNPAIAGYRAECAKGRLLRRHPHSYRAFLRRLSHGHAENARRGVRVRQGRGHPARGWPHDAIAPTARLPRRIGPCHLSRHDAGTRGRGLRVRRPRTVAGGTRRNRRRRGDRRVSGLARTRSGAHGRPRARGRSRRPGRGPLRLAGDRRVRRTQQQSRKLHDLHRLRIHVLRAREPEPASQRDLPGQRRAAAALRPPRLPESGGSLGVDGRQAGRGYGRPRHTAQLERLRRLDVPRRELGAGAHRCGLRGPAHAQRTARGKHPGERHLGYPSPAVAERRVGRLRAHGAQGRQRPAIPRAGRLRA